MTHEILKRIDLSNSKFKHYAYIPSKEEYHSFHEGDSDLFKKSIGDKQRYLFSAKDIFNTYVYPTQMGSPLWSGFKAGNNARIISDLLWKGDILVGKTKTSEFAVHEETEVINPWNDKRTVGTSSAGAPISILVDNLDYALATQTAGSIGRPASYCGVLAMKPTYGLIPRTGILKTCDPFDSVGVFVKNLDIMQEILGDISKIGNNYPSSRSKNFEDSSKKKVGFIQSKKINFSDNATSKLQDIKNFLDDNNFEAVEIELPSFADVHKHHELIYAYSLSYYFSKELKNKEDVSDSFKSYVELGKSLSSEKFIDLLKSHEVLITEFDKWMEINNLDFLISPSTNDVAPVRFKKEIDDLNLMYTFFRVPALYLPLGFDKNRFLPFGFSVTSKRFNDSELIKFGKALLQEFNLNEGNSYQRDEK